MFYDDSIAGNWAALFARLNANSTVPRWSEVEPSLAGVRDVEAVVALLDEHANDDRSDSILGALIRLASGERSPDDALLLLLHCLSGVALGLARDLRDLHDDILLIVVGELTCQIRTYPQRGRTRAFAENLRLETRRALLEELRPGVRNHPELGEQLTNDGQLPRPGVDPLSAASESDGAVDLVALLEWSIRSGVDADEVLLVIETERARAAVGRDRRVARAADRDVARAHGLCERTLYRRRNRTLVALRRAAVEFFVTAA